MTIHVEKRIHQVWSEYMHYVYYSAARGMRLPSPIVGKYQYILTNEKGQEISLVELPNYFSDGVTLWEIYCLEGDLFEDIERFETYDEAMEKAKKYLEKKN